MGDPGRRIALVLVLGSPSLGCSRIPSALPPAVVVRGDGAVDIELGLRDTGGGRNPARFRAEARDGSTRLGFDIALDLESSTVRIESLGRRSDAFLTFLDERYRTGRHPPRMRSQVEATAIALGGDPSGSPLMLKLFFEVQGPPEPPSAENEGGPGTPEVYLNLDFARARVCWCEKDDGYRSDLIFALSERGPAR